jgi:dethiobiotin synthetase
MNNNIYVAATSQHVGKTTCTLGLTAALKHRGLQVGYCKPVGQEFVDLGDLKVDKDALLFSTIMGFILNPALHSPVIVGAGLTKAYLEHPEDYDFNQRILYAAETLSQANDILVMEGTGHPGVGSVIDMSNADVARLTGARLVMVVEGGIGSTIDELNAKLALFREQNVPVSGVIINKVLPTKMDQVKYYVGKKLDKYGIPLLGVLPFDKTLTHPIMDTIMKAVKGNVVFHEDQLDNRIEHIVSGALVERGEFEAQHHHLVIVHHQGLDDTIAIVEAFAQLHHMQGSPLSGIIIHGNGDFLPAFHQKFTRRDYIDQYRIPVIATTLDTYGAAMKIGKIEVKINTRTLWKADRAVDLFEKYVNIEPLLT